MFFNHFLSALPDDKAFSMYQLVKQECCICNSANTVYQWKVYQKYNKIKPELNQMFFLQTTAFSENIQRSKSAMVYFKHL